MISGTALCIGQGGGGGEAQACRPRRPLHAQAAGGASARRGTHGIPQTSHTAAIRAVRVQAVAQFSPVVVSSVCFR
eukprot:6615244-Pyramimonas_sp.AAC.1